jgi:hypothetical protein
MKLLLLRERRHVNPLFMTGGFTMYCPPGKWKIFSGGANGDLQINFLGGAGDPINGSVFGQPMDGNWLTTTGDISFRAADGSYYTGTLIKPRENWPEAATYTLAGTVNPSGFVWVAEIYVVP